MALRLNESNIALNCLCPGMVESSMTGPILSVLTKDHLTSHASVMKAYDRFLDGEEIGCVAEISRDNIYLRQHHDYADEMQEWICTNVPKLLGNRQLNTSSK
jgi:NAD(P)-dependent dehydrogenase (short-subunit alcohol dehydrogenase family)